MATACGSDAVQTADASRSGAPPDPSAPSESDDASPAADAPSGTLVIGVPDLGSETWVPRRTTTGEKQLFDLVGDTLIRNDPETRALLPGLAESWSLSDDGLTWTFNLREGIPFHDDWGTVTSEDVQFTWAEILKEDSTHGRAGLLSAAVGGDMSNFEIVSDTEFRIHTPNALATLPNVLMHAVPTITIQSKEYWETVGEEEAGAHPIGTGPFRFVSHEPGQQVTVTAVDDHWRQTPSFETVILRIVPDEASRLVQLASGDLDIAPISLTQKREAEAAGLQLFNVPATSVASLYFGGFFPGEPEEDLDAPWIQADNPEQGLAVRQAMNLAIDRDAIVDAILLGEGEAAEAPIAFPPGPFDFNDPAWEVPAYDPDRARELLAEGGYPDGFSVDMPIFSLPGRANVEDVAEAVAGMLTDIGIEVNRQPMDYEPTFRSVLIEKATAGMVYVWATPFYDELTDALAQVYYPGSAAPLAHMYHPAITQFVDAAGAELDYDARMSLARDLGETLIDEVVGVPLVSLNLIYAAGPNVGEWPIVPGAGPLHNVEYITHADE